MNLLSLPIVRLFIKMKTQLLSNFGKTILFIVVSFMHVSVKAWDVDMSRRSTDMQRMKISGPTNVDMTNRKVESRDGQSLLTGIFSSSLEPTQEVVILNTDKGFVPETLNLKAGQSYKIHVVNVNEKEKNASFILDAFSEHHGTFFGQPKTFEIAPRMEGIFSFQCPETAKQGRIVVAPAGDSRRPASAK